MIELLSSRLNSIKDTHYGLAKRCVKLSSFFWTIFMLDLALRYTDKSTYSKGHDSVSVDTLQRKEAEQSACGILHDPAFKITEIYFQKKLLCNFSVKNGNY